MTDQVITAIIACVGVISTGFFSYKGIKEKSRSSKEILLLKSQNELANNEMQQVIKKEENDNKRLELIEKMVFAQLFNTIVHVAKKCIVKGCISQSDYNILDTMYKSYREAGGNGIAQKLMEEVYELPLEELCEVTKK